MAKPKHTLLIEVFDNNISPSISVHIANAGTYEQEIAEIEGVTRAFDFSEYLIVFTDLRYDVYEVAEEIRVLLLSEVPKVFREE